MIVMVFPQSPRNLYLEPGEIQLPMRGPNLASDELLGVLFGRCSTWKSLWASHRQPWQFPLWMIRASCGA